MKQLSSILAGMVTMIAFGTHSASAAPTLYISNQTQFDRPLVYVCGFGVPGDYSTWFDFGYDGISEGQIQKGGITFDKFSLPDTAIGKTANVQYSNYWSNNKDDYEITFEDKDYYLIANADGLTPYIEGGNNVYYMMFVETSGIQNFKVQKKNLLCYAKSEDGSELYGAAPGKPYGCSDYIDKTGYFIFNLPSGNKAYTLTFTTTEKDVEFTVTPDFTITPNKDWFLKLTDTKAELTSNPKIAVVDEGILNYTIDKSAKTATVNGLIDPDKGAENLVIPSTVTIDNTKYDVTMIQDGAFKGLRNITGTLTLGENLIRIGDNAFNGCQNLTGGLIIGNNVKYIGESAFSACINLNGTLTLGNSIETISKNAFLFTSKLTGDLTIPNSVVIIGEGAFNGCSSFNGKFTIGNSVTTIGAQAFVSCSGLTGDLTLPNSITSLGESVFMGCSGLDGKLTLPENLTSLAPNLFFNCSKLSGNLQLPAGLTKIDSQAFFGCSSFTGSLAIPSTVTEIGKGAFSNCSGFNGGLDLGTGVVNIGEGAFQLCSKFFGWLTLPESLVTIGDNAFSMCEKFSGPLTIPKNVITIGNMAFAMCEGFKGSLKIGENVKEIGEQAFVGCSGFTGTLTIPEGVKSIGYRTFGWLYNLTALVLPSTLETLGNCAFLQCWNLQTITCNATVPPVIKEGDKAFTVDNYNKANLVVPSAEAYKKAYEWKDFLIVNGVNSSVNDMVIDTEETAVYYNLQGQRIAQPEKGEILIKQTSKGAQKIVF